MHNSSLKLLVTGGQGQLAHAICGHTTRHFQIIACTRKDLDITSPESITHAFAKLAPDIVINTAAYTAVDQAEREPDQAQLINHIGAKNLAIACAQRQIPLIHLSTDYIFDGKKTSPYTEDDTPSPLNHYGHSKWLGEQAVRAHCHQHIILRVSGIFSEHGNNFFNTMLKLVKNNTNLRVVADQITCPTYASDIADTLITLAKNPSHWGTYHYCSTPPISWHQFAEAILNIKIHAITTADYPTPAKRPAYSVLDCQKIATDYAITQPSWQQAIWKLQ